MAVTIPATPATVAAAALMPAIAAPAAATDVHDRWRVVGGLIDHRRGREKRERIDDDLDTTSLDLWAERTCQCKARHCSE